MSEQPSAGYPGEKFSKSREASREAERSNLLAAKEQYNSLSPELQNQIDAFSDAVTNVIIEKAEAELGDKWYGGSEFNKKLSKAMLNFASGFSRDNESLQKAFNSSVGDRRVAEIAFEVASSYLDAFPDLKELQLAKKTEIIDSGTRSENTVSFELEEPLQQLHVTPDFKKDFVEERENEDLVLEKELPISSLENKINWLKSVVINTKKDIESAVDAYLERHPNESRAIAVDVLFNNANISPDISESRKQETLKASIVDNFTYAPITSKEELKRLIEHHEYKYASDLDKVGLSRHEIANLLISHGKFTPEFTKMDGIKALLK